MSQRQNKPGSPFRPQPDDLEAIAEDVSEISDIQQKLRDRHADLCVRDRVAHQYQIAGGKVKLSVSDTLPPDLEDVGLFIPGAEHWGIGRVSTGLGTPHIETNPDFLGLMFAFCTHKGDRVDFLGINDPAAPTDDHCQFMSVLHATGESAGAKIPFVGDWGEYDLGNIIAEQKELGKALLAREGLKAPGMLAHLVKQSSRTFRSSTAYQAYWTGIVEVSETLGKFTLVPTLDENTHPKFRPGERHLSDEWKVRQQRGAIEFVLYWIPWLDEDTTPTVKLTEAWAEDHKRPVGKITFPRSDPESEAARTWAILASEMGANPGNWVHNRENSVPEPSTVFTTARKIAYRRSQQGRNALNPKTYRSVFESGTIGPELAQELKRRRDEKERLGHVSWSP